MKNLIAIILLSVSLNVYSECKEVTIYKDGKYSTIVKCSIYPEPTINSDLINRIKAPKRRCKFINIEDGYQYVCKK